MRTTLKRISFIRTAYYWLLFFRNSILTKINRLFIFLFSHDDYKLLKEMEPFVRSLYPSDLHFTNKLKFYVGNNVLGYPAMTFIEKDGKSIGWQEGRVVVGGEELTLMQLQTDKEVNFPNLFSKYKPELIADFGTASGGTAVYFHQLVSAYSTDPKIISVDIWDRDFVSSSKFHELYKTREKVQFIFGKSSVDCGPEISKFLEQRKPGQRVLLSFDDLHTYEHTYQELVMFAPMLQSGDVILMQDTWNQGMYGNETSPMLAVYRFLKEHPDFTLDENFCRNMVLPCNCIYGVIVKK